MSGKTDTTLEFQELNGIWRQLYLRQGSGSGRLTVDVHRPTEGTRFIAPQRMQLVVMAAVLALVRVGQGCSSDCRLTNISILVESCGLTELIHTTICAGQCYQVDPVYIGYNDWAEQTVCNGDWTYEVKHIEGCPVGVSYPVATSCKCTTCNSGNTYCGRFHGDIPSCLPF